MLTWDPNVVVCRDHPYMRIEQSTCQGHFLVNFFIYVFVCGTCMVDTSEVEEILMPTTLCCGGVGLDYCRYFVTCQCSVKLSSMCMERVFFFFPIYVVLLLP